MSDSPLNTQSMNTCEKALPRLLGMKRRRGSEASASIYLVKRTQFFSPARVQAARDWQAIKDTKEALRQQGIVDKKALAAAKKQQKELNKIERARLLAKRRQQAAEAKAQKAVEKQAQIELKEAVYRASKGSEESQEAGKRA